MLKAFGMGGLLAAATLTVAGPAQAQDMVTFSGSIGVITLEANEYVYVAPGDDTRLSHLIWQSTAPVLNAGFDVSLPDGWTFAAKAQVALGGDSYMEDFDWIAPYATGTGDDDWSDRSQHDDTDLDWYFNGSMLIGYDMALTDTVTVNVNGGLKYTDVQWAAYGGSFVYSDGAPRDTVGDFPDGEPGITYRQTFPAAVAGLDIEHSDGPLTVGASVQAGVTFSAVGDDHHWMRDVNFIDTLESAPLLAVGASAGYEVAEGVQLFVAAQAEQIFTARADTDAYDISTGDYLWTEEDQAGGDLFAASVSVGLTGSF
jgi:outer membrane protease